MDNVIDKKIKKVIEAIIVEYEKEFSDKFGENEYKEALKHKAKVTDVALEDSQLRDIIKDEVEDCIGVYLLSRPVKKRRS